MTSRPADRETIYAVRMPWGERLRIRVDLSQAASPIRYEGEEGEWHSTPYQCADARHRSGEALRLVLRHLGREYYAAPDDERDEDAILAELSELTVREESEAGHSRAARRPLAHGR